MILRLATFAMNTRFELVLIGDDEPRLRAAAEEAFAEVESCEQRLSLFRPGSLLSHINRHASPGPVGIDRETFGLLAAARRLSDLTEGAFDPTVAPLMKLWKLHDDGSSASTVESLVAARALVGMHLVELDDAALTVRFTRDGVSLDLGGIAKGHALGAAERVLRAAGVESALMHAGTSSVTAIGAPPGEAGWKVGLARVGSGEPSEVTPGTQGSPVKKRTGRGRDEAAKEFPALADSVVLLRDESLSVSAPHGRCAVVDGRLVSHIIDPRTGVPSPAVPIAAAIADDPTVAEGLSTALIVLGRRPANLPARYRTILPPVTDCPPPATERSNGV